LSGTPRDHVVTNAASVSEFEDSSVAALLPLGGLVAESLEWVSEGVGTAALSGALILFVLSVGLTLGVVVKVALADDLSVWWIGTWREDVV
jgi:hypothetical protein